MNVESSLTDTNDYRQFCLSAAMNYHALSLFRRDALCRSIVDTVSPEQGRQYLDLILEDPAAAARLPELLLNDNVGSPVVANYPGVGEACPTTLRYIKVLSDLRRRFGPLEGMSICEIGVGYGGQCRILDAADRPASYTLVDLTPALMLAQRYLEHFIINGVLAFRSMNELAPADYDLVISNYAFSELRREIQDVYLRKAILRSARGYILHNDIAPADFNAYSAAELVALIPGAKLLPEQPLTYARNSLIVWG